MALVVWRAGAWKLRIVRRFDASGFKVLPKRWIVERTFGRALWTGRLRPHQRAAPQRWSRFPEQNGGLAKVDSGLGYAANFSSVACVA